jgi:hypothetical protein
VEVQLIRFLTWALHKGELLISCTFSFMAYSGEIAADTHFLQGWMGRKTDQTNISVTGYQTTILWLPIP